MNEFKDRLLTEQKELNDKIEKLGDFCSTERFGLLDIMQQELLQLQHKTMETYSGILKSRLRLLAMSTGD